LGTPETRYAKSGEGAHICYQTVGEGTRDVVLCRSHWHSVEELWDEPSFAHFLGHVATFSRLILFDKRGTGLSDPLPGSESTALEDWVEDCRTVMGAIGSEHATLLGYGSGCLEALLFAATHPERTSALVLVNGYASSSAHAMAQVYPAPARGEFVGGVWVRDEEGLEEALERERADPTDSLRVLAPSAAEDPGFIRWYQKSRARTVSPAGALALARVHMQSDVREILPSIAVPTLVLHTVGNAYRDVEQGRFVAEHITGARFVEVEGADHLFWAGECVNVILDEIEEFVTGHRPALEPDRVLATVLFTDIVGSTEKAAHLGDRRWRELLDVHDATVRKEIEHHRGREVDTAGDGFLATFDGPARAVRCACAIRDAVRAHGIEVRAGVHTGEIELRGDDVAGIAVHVGSRVSALAGPGEVLVSSTVVDLVAGSGLEFRERGEHELKGVPRKWTLFEVVS
jgi:class 3 adenylate cyclase